MPYEQSSAYVKVFDRTQAPAYLGFLACRAGCLVPLRSKSIYLDLGCASGSTLLALAPLYPDIRFIGVDFNPLHIERATTEVKRLGLSNLEFLAADFRDPPVSLPKANWLVVRGTYSWLDREAKQALERYLELQAAAGALLKLHYSVRPGACLRQGLMTMIQSALAGQPTPAQGRDLATELLQEIGPLSASFSQARTALEAMPNESDEAWRHDIFNPDFELESAQQVLQRLASHGFSFLASCRHECNLPSIQISPAMAARVAQLSPPAAQTLIDHLTANGSRDDLLVKSPHQSTAPGYPDQQRFGVIAPAASLVDPYPTVRGEVRFERDDCRILLRALHSQPMTMAELRHQLPPEVAAELPFWLDLLIAAGRIGPFLPVDQVARLDREFLRRINRERIQSAICELSTSIRVPLLAAEYGNCLVAGWFESLILANFEQRHHPSVHQEVLMRMHSVGMAFGDGHGQRAPNQLEALQQTLAQLETNYLSKLAYWGIDI